MAAGGHALQPARCPAAGWRAGGHDPGAAGRGVQALCTGGCSLLLPLPPPLLLPATTALQSSALPTSRTASPGWACYCCSIRSTILTRLTPHPAHWSPGSHVQPGARTQSRPGVPGGWQRAPLHRRRSYSGCCSHQHHGAPRPAPAGGCPPSSATHACWTRLTRPAVLKGGPLQPARAPSQPGPTTPDSRTSLPAAAQVFLLSICQGRATPGSQLMNLRYRDEASMHAAAAQAARRAACSSASTSANASSSAPAAPAAGPSMQALAPAAGGAPACSADQQLPSSWQPPPWVSETAPRMPCTHPPAGSAQGTGARARAHHAAARPAGSTWWAPHAAPARPTRCPVGCSFMADARVWRGRRSAAASGCCLGWATWSCPTCGTRSANRCSSASGAMTREWQG